MKTKQDNREIKEKNTDHLDSMRYALMFRKEPKLKWWEWLLITSPWSTLAIFWGSILIISLICQLIYYFIK